MQNEMRDRLVELIDDFVHYENVNDLKSDECKEGLADYLTEEGNVIVPPCKVGDTVYYIAGNKVYKSKCHAITLQPSMQIHLYDYDGDNARYSTKCVFPTPEEAEKALKEGADNG